VVIRDLRAGEEDFLREMLYAALAWNPERELPPAEWVLAHPKVVIFHRDWGRDGDIALVAEDETEPLGLVWWRLFTEEEHGEGYVDEATPELAIAVRDGYRGRGIGRNLMDAAARRLEAGRPRSAVAQRRSGEPGEASLRAPGLGRVRAR
jgi:[ribosomal protein S18]-alanine N-acetyltransferase